MPEGDPEKPNGLAYTLELRFLLPGLVFCYRCLLTLCGLNCDLFSEWLVIIILYSVLNVEILKEISHWLRTER